MNNRELSLNDKLRSLVFEAKRRTEWFIAGIGVHGLTAEEFQKVPTEKICEWYDVELSFFQIQWFDLKDIDKTKIRVLPSFSSTATLFSTPITNADLGVLTNQNQECIVENYLKRAKKLGFKFKVSKGFGKTKQVWLNT